jgi:hypothetical protein
VQGLLNSLRSRKVNSRELECSASYFLHDPTARRQSTALQSLPWVQQALKCRKPSSW